MRTNCSEHRIARISVHRNLSGLFEMDSAKFAGAAVQHLRDAELAAVWLTVSLDDQPVIGKP